MANQFIGLRKLQSRRHTGNRWLSLGAAADAVEWATRNERQSSEAVEPAEAKFEVRAAAPLPTSPNPEGQKVNNGIRKLAIHLTGVERQRIAVPFTPVTGDPDDLPAAPKVIPLSEW